VYIPEAIVETQEVLYFVSTVTSDLETRGYAAVDEILYGWDEEPVVASGSVNFGDPYGVFSDSSSYLAGDISSGSIDLQVS
jgi:hypothetical protein